MEIVYRAADAIEAHLIQGLLQQQDIKSYINGEYLHAAVGEIPAADFVNITVDENDASQARTIITQYDSGFDSVNKKDVKTSLANKIYLAVIISVFLIAVSFLLS